MIRPCLRFLLAGLVGGAAWAQPAQDPVEAVTKAANDWAALRLEAVKLDTEWKSERALLDSSQAALRDRETFLRNRRDALVAQGAGDRDSLGALRRQVADVRAELATSETRLQAAGARLLALRPWLPPRLSSALELSFKTLAEPPGAPGDRMQLLVRMLNRCAQFNRNLTYADEIVPAPDGTPRMLEVLYWGLSHAYALDRVNKAAYLGHPGEKAWQWDPLPGQADQVARLFAIQRDQADPDFVLVPARVSPLPASR